jgi:CHAD domain-containing protein
MAEKRKFSWKAGQSSVQNAAEVLPALAAAFFAHGRALTSPSAPEALHAFRIQLKRLRDTLELFQPCYNRHLERLLKALQELQQTLGELNALAATHSLLVDRGFDESRPNLFGNLDARIAEKARQFFSIWQDTFAREDEARRWVNYLATGMFRPTRPVHKTGRR